MGNKKSVMVESHHRFDTDKLEYDIEIKYIDDRCVFSHSGKIKKGRYILKLSEKGFTINNKKFIYQNIKNYGTCSYNNNLSSSDSNENNNNIVTFIDVNEKNFRFYCQDSLQLIDTLNLYSKVYKFGYSFRRK